MTKKGVDFLTEWVKENVLPLPVTSNTLFRNLTDKLKDEARAAGFSVEELEIENSQIEDFIRETLDRVAVRR